MFSFIDLKVFADNSVQSQVYSVCVPEQCIWQYLTPKISQKCHVSLR